MSRKPLQQPNNMKRSLNQRIKKAVIVAATSLCIALGFLIYTGYVLTFSTYGAMDVYSRLHKWIDGTVAGLFALAGLGLIKSAFSR